MLTKDIYEETAIFQYSYSHWGWVPTTASSATNGKSLLAMTAPTKKYDRHMAYDTRSSSDLAEIAFTVEAGQARAIEEQSSYLATS